MSLVLEAGLATLDGLERLGVQDLYDLHEQASVKFYNEWLAAQED